MSNAAGLRPEDRADFEAVLQLALCTTDIRSALRADPTGEFATRLRARALADADEIATAAQGAYDVYLTRLALNTSTTRETEDASEPGSLLPALAVLTPLVSASSAAVLLVLGYVLQLAAVRGTLPGSLVTAGWILGLVAALSALVALVAVVGAAAFGRGGSAHSARLEQARQDWQRALLERGLLPYLRRCIAEDWALKR
ncbi:hypothetical protein [Streptomyces sp. NPDC002328]|uniref:hypothetical protein n=1 Tax=Streptomyces sp. NPDC002328 TaxID=3364642 RepID=UPI00367A556E